MAEIQAPSLQDEAQSLLVARSEGVWLTAEGRELVLRAIQESEPGEARRMAEAAAAAEKDAQLWQERAEAAEAKLTALRAVLDVSPAVLRTTTVQPPLSSSAEPVGDFPRCCCGEVEGLAGTDWRKWVDGMVHRRDGPCFSSPDPCVCGHDRAQHAGDAFCKAGETAAGGPCFCQKFTIASDSAAEVVGTPEVGTVDPKWGRVGESAWHIFIFNGISVAVCGEAIDAPAVYSQPTDPEQVCLDCLDSGHQKAVEYKASLTPAPPASAAKKRNVPDECVIPGCTNKGAARNQWCCPEHAAKLNLQERQAALAAWKRVRKSAPAAEAASG